MDKKNIEEIKSKLLEINKTISQLDPSIRSQAFEILSPYYFPAIKSLQQLPAKDQPEKNNTEPDISDLGSFISTFETDKPADNVTLLVAWLYSNYGVYPINPKEIKELGDACGMIIPNRSDNTMRNAKKNGKSLFTQKEKGWQLTVGGEIFLKEFYKVKKGNKPIPKD